MTLIRSIMLLVTTAAIIAPLSACEKRSPSNAAAPAAGATKSGAAAASGDDKAPAETYTMAVAVSDTVESLGVELPSFDDLRAKAGESITPENADAEFQKLQLEAEAEGG